MVKVQALKLALREYHEVIAVVKKEIAERVPVELRPFIDWQKIPKVEFVATTIKCDDIEEVKMYIATQPFAVVIKNDNINAIQLHSSSEYEISDELLPYLHEEVKRVLGLMEKKEEIDEEEI